MADQAAISIVGLGKLGSPMLACLASKGFRVIGLDVNEQTLQLLAEGRAPVLEPQLEDLLRVHRVRIALTRDYGKAVNGSNVTFVVVPTPSEPDGTFSLRYVRAACEQIGDALRWKRGFHVVVVTSTVLPEDMQTVVLATLEQRAGKRCGQDFGLCYSPEFITLGSAIDDMLHPDFVLIGQSDERSGTILEGIYRRTVGDGVPVVKTTFVNAELAKIALNTFVTTKISYANMLAEICEHIPGCDVDVVTQAIALDSRINAKYFSGRLSYGGPCFPRDNLAFSAMARKRGTTAALADVTDTINRHQARRLQDRVLALVPPTGQIGVLGLAYKPGTDVVEESPGIKLAQGLAEARVPVVVYDPLAMTTARAVLGDAVAYASSTDECIQKANVVVIATPWEEFRGLTPAQLAHNPRRVVFDCWRVLRPEQVRDVADYVTVGTA
jgi:UDPglucose 6-dehydrogenase